MSELVILTMVIVFTVIYLVYVHMHVIANNHTSYQRGFTTVYNDYSVLDILVIMFLWPFIFGFKLRKNNERY